MSKPIEPLLRHFFPTLERIAPEKANELREMVDNLGLTLELKETDESFFFFVNPSTKTITAGEGALGRRRATAYGYFCLYTTVAGAKIENPEVRELDLKDGERMRQASALLEWALEVERDVAEANQQKKTLPPVVWPAGLPCPTQHPNHASDLHVADELFLCAGAFILHHELAHIRLGHKASSNSDEMKRIEDEADLAAAEWILNSLTENDKRFTKRALGVALALSWLASVAVFVPEDQDHHPPSCERLYRVINKVVTDVNHVVWAFVGTILRVNMEARRMVYDKTREATSFRDDVKYCIRARA